MTAWPPLAFTPEIVDWRTVVLSLLVMSLPVVPGLLKRGPMERPAAPENRSLVPGAARRRALPGSCRLPRARPRQLRLAGASCSGMGEGYRGGSGGGY